MRFSREKYTLLGESGVHGLMLPPHWNTVQLESHVVTLTRIPGKRSMESQANLFLVKDVYATFEPVSLSSVRLLDEYTIP